MEIVTAIAGKVVDLTVVSIGRQLGYLFFYNNNVNKLKTSVENLKAKMDDTNISVEEAKQIGETNVLPSVQKWIEEAEVTIADAAEVIEKEAQGEGRCLKWPFPNLCKRYNLSREAKKLEGDVSNAMLEGKFEKVCFCPRPEMSLPPSARDYEAMSSRTSTLDAVKEALKNPDICMVGVYGMGGVGKTTLAKELAWQAEKEGLFSVVVMATITSAPNLRGIQGQLADGLGLKLNSETEEGRAADLRKRILTEKSILVILDDIWGELDLTKVGVPYGDQHKGCKLVLTGRDLNVLHRMGTQTDFPLGVLSEEESWSLFESMAGDVVRHGRVEAIAVKVVKCCFGLPLLIVAVAKALRKTEDVRVWKDALTRLKVFDHEDYHKSVSERLKFSYDCLKIEELRSLFLLIASFDHGFNNYDGSLNAEELVPICWALGLYKNVSSVEEARNRHYTLVKELMDCSLLLESEINRVRMHDLVRDMAKSIASTTCPTYVVQRFTDINEWPNKDQLQKFHHIIMPQYAINELPGNIKCPNLKLFFLRFIGVNNPNVRANFFSGMPEVKVLHLNIEYPNFLSIPSSLWQLKNLRSLEISGEFEGIEMIGKLRSLEILKLNIHKMEELPKEVGHLTQLRVLNVSGCERLRLIPRNVLSSLKFLEELYMLGSAIEWEAEDNNATLAELENLQKLKILELRIKDALTFPKDLYHVANLWERYTIIIGKNPLYQHRNLYKKSYDRSLDLRDLGDACVYKSMNDVVKILLTNAEKLYLADLDCVEDIHPGLNRDGSLLTQSFHMLEFITVEKCNKLKNLLLWSHVSNLSQLREIVISKCQSMKAIIAEESNERETIELPELRYLVLDNLPNLVSFCSMPKKIDMEFVPSSALIDKKVEMPSLETMALFRMNTRMIWDDNLPTYSCVQNLTDLSIHFCHNLKTLFPSSVARALTKLQRLIIMNCKKVEEIFEEEENPVNQESLLNPQVMLPNLKVLVIWDLENLKLLWCNQMAPNSFYKLSQMDIRKCPKLINTFSWSVLNHVLNLKTLQIRQCDDLHVIVEKSECGEVRRVNLEELEIFFCRRLKNIVTSSVIFPNLSVLTVRCCHEIANIMTSPSTAASLPKLEVLKIYECDMIEEIVACENNDGGGAPKEIAFMKLEVLELCSLWSLKWFCKGAYTFKFPSLGTVRLKYCPRMETFCNGNLIAPNLTVVNTSWLGLEISSSWDGDLNTTIKNIFTQEKARSSAQTSVKI